MTDTTRLAIVAIVALTAVACNAKDVSNRNPLAPSTVSVAPPAATSTTNAAPSAVRSVSGQPPGTCVPASSYIRCWHFRPTLVLWVSPNARWARGGTPFVPLPAERASRSTATRRSCGLEAAESTASARRAP